MKKIQTEGLISIQEDPKDKRKNIYRPAEFLINYHQSKFINSPVDNSKKYPSKLGGNSKKNRSKLGGTFGDTAQNQAVLLNKKTSEDQLPVSVQGFENSPKAILKAKEHKSKERVNPLSILDSYEFNAEERAIADRLKCDLQLVFDKFIAKLKNKQQKTFVRGDFLLWLLNEKSTLSKNIKQEEVIRPKYFDFTQERLDREAAARNLRN